MKKFFVAGLLLLFILFSCTQYVFVPFPGGGDSGDDETVENSGDIWDGTVETSWYDSEESIYKIETSEQLAGLVKLVNENGETFEDKTIILMNDIDLDNRLWTPIGPNADAVERFQGTFDGNGKVIRNLKINQEAAYKAAGLFGALNGIVKDLVIDGAEIASISEAGSSGTTNGIAVLAGSLYPSGRVENVKISNFSVSGNRYVGGIAGYSSANVGTEIRNCIVENGSLIATPDNLTGNYDNGDKVGGIIGYCVVGDIVEGCIVSNVSLKGYRDVGGVIGYRNTSEDGGNPIIKNNKVSDIDITIDGEHNYNNYDSEEDFDAGVIIGDTYGGNVDSSNSSSNCTIKYINTDF